MDELYLDNIDEFVNDHNKIVTYKWLSLTLGVHVNTAKQMLFHYLDHKRKESSPQLHATYLVSGKFVHNGQTCHKVSVVREDQLENFKAKMSLVVSIHVYSVQKALLKDSGPLYGVDYDAVKDHLKSCSQYSAIRCASAVPMSSSELQQARQIQQAPVHEPENKKSALNGDANPTSKPSTKAPKGIMGMFSKQSVSKNQDNLKETSEQNQNPPAVEAPKSKAPVKANPVTNFFGNQTKKVEKSTKEEEAAPSAEDQRPSSEPEEKHETASKPSQKDTKKASRSKTKRVDDSDSEDEKMEKKKRRRIKKPEPDSSDEDVIPDSPQQVEPKEKSPEKKVEAIQHVQGDSEPKIRRRRRVMKSRNFLDEEGCMVTEKVYESESYSETEEDIQASKKPVNVPVKAKLPSVSKENEKKKKTSASANKGTKQASIMGFFQKK